MFFHIESHTYGTLSMKRWDLQHKIHVTNARASPEYNNSPRMRC